jgi:hypothetical protein
LPVLVNREVEIGTSTYKKDKKIYFIKNSTRYISSSEAEMSIYQTKRGAGEEKRKNQDCGKG